MPLLGFVGLRLLLAAGAGFLAGLMLDSALGGLAVTFALYLAWELATLVRVEWWLRHRGWAEAPETFGKWESLVSQIVRLHRRKSFHKQRLLAVLRQLRRSTAALPDGVVVLDAQREIEWFNDTAARLLSLQRTVDRGLRIDNLLRQPEFARYLDAREFTNPVVIQPTGTDVHLALHAVPYGDDQHLLLVRDVSRQIRLEAMRKDFVANASHELRSPLTVVSGYIETLAQDRELDPAFQMPLAEMQRQTARMTAIVRDLLELSRLEANEEEAGGEPLDVQALMAMLRKDVLARARHPAEIRMRFESNLTLVGVEGEIHSAFSNLVDNAAKYTPESGSIEMRWWTDSRGGHFSVADTGMGIPRELIPRLTERFYRVDPGRSRETGGSGLGLAIVKHVLQRHGATLEIASDLGKGSTFTCHFPERRLAPPLDVDAAAAASAH